MTFFFLISPFGNCHKLSMCISILLKTEVLLPKTHAGYGGEKQTLKGGWLAPWVKHLGSAQAMISGSGD